MFYNLFSGLFYSLIWKHLKAITNLYTYLTIPYLRYFYPFCQYLGRISNAHDKSLFQPGCSE